MLRGGVCGQQVCHALDLGQVHQAGVKRAPHVLSCHSSALPVPPHRWVHKHVMQPRQNTLNFPTETTASIHGWSLHIYCIHERHVLLGLDKRVLTVTMRSDKFYRTTRMTWLPIVWVSVKSRCLIKGMHTLGTCAPCLNVGH